jgi:hypothetical protein
MAKATRSNKNIAASGRPGSKQPQVTAEKPALVACFPEAKRPRDARARAEFAVRPSTSAALVIEAYPTGEQELSAVADALEAGAQQVRDGDLSTAEAMLHGQAQALQAIFMTLSRNARGHHDVRSFDSCLRMALKAQNQSRMTLETMASLRAPRTVFAKQANISNGGNQQINNLQGGVGSEDSLPRKNGLLEVRNEQWLDPRTPSSAGRDDPSLETVGAVDRS